MLEDDFFFLLCLGFTASAKVFFLFVSTTVPTAPSGEWAGIISALSRSDSVSEGFSSVNSSGGLLGVNTPASKLKEHCNFCMETDLNLIQNQNTYTASIPVCLSIFGN